MVIMTIVENQFILSKQFYRLSNTKFKFASICSDKSSWLRLKISQNFCKLWNCFLQNFAFFLQNNHCKQKSLTTTMKWTKQICKNFHILFLIFCLLSTISISTVSVDCLYTTSIIVNNKNSSNNNVAIVNNGSESIVVVNNSNNSESNNVNNNDDNNVNNNYDINQMINEQNFKQRYLWNRKFPKRNSSSAKKKETNFEATHNDNTSQSLLLIGKSENGSSIRENKNSKTWLSPLFPSTISPDVNDDDYYPKWTPIPTLIPISDSESNNVNISLDITKKFAPSQSSRKIKSLKWLNSLKPHLLHQPQQQINVNFSMKSIIDINNRDTSQVRLPVNGTMPISQLKIECSTITTQLFLIFCKNTTKTKNKITNNNNNNFVKSVQTIQLLDSQNNSHNDNVNRINVTLSKEKELLSFQKENPLDTENSLLLFSNNNSNNRIHSKVQLLHNNSKLILLKNKRTTIERQIQKMGFYSSLSSSSYNGENTKNNSLSLLSLSSTTKTKTVETNVNKTGLIIGAINDAIASSASAVGAIQDQPDHSASSSAKDFAFSSRILQVENNNNNKNKKNGNFTIPTSTSAEHLSVAGALFQQHQDYWKHNPNGSNYKFDCLNNNSSSDAASIVTNSSKAVAIPGNTNANANTSTTNNNTIIINCTLITLMQQHHKSWPFDKLNNNNNNNSKMHTKESSATNTNNNVNPLANNNNSDVINNDDNLAAVILMNLSHSSKLPITELNPHQIILHPNHNSEITNSSDKQHATRDINNDTNNEAFYDISLYQREETLPRPEAQIVSPDSQKQTIQQQGSNNQQQQHEYYYSGTLRDNDPSVLLSRYPSLRLPPPPPEFADEFNEGMTEINTVSGGRVEIPCNTSSWIEDEVSLVLWFRGDTGVPIYRVDARSVPLVKSTHTTAEELRQRFHFDINAKPPVLQINPVLPSDAAEYRCRVDFRQSRTQNVLIALNVTVPPKEVLIMDIEGQKLEGVIGPYDENSNVLLICEAEGGKPSPEVNWYQGSRLIDSSFTTGPHGLVRNELNIRNINRTDFMSILTCRASNNNVTEPVSATVILDMNLRPLDVKILTNNKLSSQSTSSLSKSGSSSSSSSLLSTLSSKVSSTTTPETWILAAGSKAEFQCQTIGSRPAAQISWWLGTERLSSNVRDSVNDDGNATISTITFVPGIEDNGKMLTCRADNLPMPHTALKDERLLTVHFAPQLRLSYGANIGRDSIREGSDVYLECRVRANPPVKEVVWLHDGHPLHSTLAGGTHDTEARRNTEEEDSGGGIAATGGTLTDPELESEQRALSAAGSSIIMTNQSLVIQKVYRTHRGRYQCVAFNEQGETVSDPLYLKVNFAPVCRKGQKRQYGVSRNEQIRIRCEVDAEPTTGLTFHWTLKTSGSETSVEWTQFTANASTSIATYRPESSLDYGLFACVAQNSIGRQSEPCIYNVVPAGRPDPVRSCAITNHSMSTLLVECVPGDDGGLRQHFNLEVYIADNKHLHSNHSSSQPNFIISSLTPGTKYTLILYATNAKGRSQSVSLTAITLLPPEKHIARGSIEQIVVHPILAILVGIVAAIVIIIVIIIMIIRHRTGICYHHHLQHTSSIRHSTNSNRNGCSGGGPDGATTTTTALTTKMNGGIKVANCNGKQSKQNGNQKSKKDKSSSNHSDSSGQNSSLLMARKKGSSSSNGHDTVASAGAIGMRQLESIVNNNNNNNNNNIEDGDNGSGGAATQPNFDNNPGGKPYCEINTTTTTNGSSLDDGVIRRHHPDGEPGAIDMTIQNNSNEILLNATERTLIASSPGTCPQQDHANGTIPGGLVTSTYSDMIGPAGSLYDNNGGLVLSHLGQQGRIPSASPSHHYGSQFSQQYMRNLPVQSQSSSSQQRHIVDLSSCSSSSPISTSPSQLLQQQPQSGILLLTDAELAAASLSSPSRHLNNSSSRSSTLTRRSVGGLPNPAPSQQYSLHPYHPYLNVNCTLPRHSSTGGAASHYQSSPHSNHSNGSSNTATNNTMQYTSPSQLMHPLYGNDGSNAGYAPVTIIDDLDSGGYITSPNLPAHHRGQPSHHHHHHPQQQHLNQAAPILYYNATNPSGNNSVGGSPIQQLIQNHRCSVGPLEPLSSASAEAQDAVYVSVISNGANNNSGSNNKYHHNHSHSHSDNETMPLLTGTVALNCNDSETGSDSTGTTATTTSGSDQSTNSSNNNQSQHTTSNSSRPYEIFLPSNVRNNGNATAV